MNKTKKMLRLTNIIKAYFAEKIPFAVNKPYIMMYKWRNENYLLLNCTKNEKPTLTFMAEFLVIMDADGSY